MATLGGLGPPLPQSLIGLICDDMFTASLMLRLARVGEAKNWRRCCIIYTTARPVGDSCYFPDLLTCVAQIKCFFCGVAWGSGIYWKLFLGSGPPIPILGRCWTEKHSHVSALNWYVIRL